MRRPSIKLRLMVGSGLLITVLLMLANYSIYERIRSYAFDEVDADLLQRVSLLSKSPELEDGRVVYEWRTAILSRSGPPVKGLFQFWDEKKGTTDRSPELEGHDLPRFYGELNKPVLKDIVLHNGRDARAAGLLHLPFSDEPHGSDLTQDPTQFPQIVVCAREIHSVGKKLISIRRKLIYTTAATVVCMWISIYVITCWTLRPIRELSERLLKRSLGEEPHVADIPEKLPTELTALATAFGTALERVEAARAHERDFALHAAHELRTPIAGIHATLEQAVSRPRPEADLRKRIGTALEITTGIRSTIASLLRLARLRGRIEPTRWSAVDCDSLIESIVERQKAGSPEARVTLELRGGPIETDDGLFPILVGNLIDNAFRHSPKGAAILIRSDRDGDQFHLAITNPRGDLREEDSVRLFQPFQRGENANADSAGAGLGLSLASEIAIMLGGKLEMLLKDNATVIFHVSIPTQKFPELPSSSHA